MMEQLKSKPTSGESYKFEIRATMFQRRKIWFTSMNLPITASAVIKLDLWEQQEEFATEHLLERMDAT